jgi:uncharacterized membrane protein
MYPGERFVMPALAGAIAYALGGLFSSTAILAAALAFLAVYLWQHLTETRRRVEFLSGEIESLRRRQPERAAPPAPGEAPSHAVPARPQPPPPQARAPLSAPPPPPRPVYVEPALPAPALPAPRDPGALDNAVATVIRFFTTGNVIAKIGVGMLFLGVSFLVKYVGDRGWLPIEARLTAAAAGAIVMVAVGWRHRAKRSFGLVLQGGGVGIFYLTIFAAFRLYSLVPANLAFGLLAVTTLCAALLAVLQDAPALAIFGASGGFLAPILTSTGQGSHVALFSYYALLNLGIFAVAWFKSWRLLNVTGFLFTFIIGGAWGVKYYEPAYFATVEPFLAGFFALYTGIAYVFSRRDASIHGVDAGLLFGTPVVAFTMQAGLVRDTAYGLALSALALGAFYTLIAVRLFRASAHNRFVVQAYVAIGAAFLTLAVPLALDGKWTAAIWAPEGAAVLWFGLRQRRALVQASGGALLAMAAVAFTGAADRPAAVWPFLNAFYVGYAVLAASYLCAGLFLHRENDRRWAALSVIFALASAAWWLLGGALEIDAVAPRWWLRLAGDTPVGWTERRSVSVHAYVGYVTLSAVLYRTLGVSLGWGFVAAFRRGLLPILAALLAAAGFAFVVHPLADIGAAAWPAALAVHYALLYRANRDGFEAEQHYLPLYLGVVLLTWELHWQGRVHLGSDTWAQLCGALVPAAFLFAASGYRGRRWPIAPFRDPYLTTGLLPLAGAALLGVGFLATRAGEASPLPFVPLLNPVDVASALLLTAVVFWFTQVSRAAGAGIRAAEFWAVVAATAFVWLTGAVIRAVHVYAGVAWSAGRILDSTVVHAALSVAWSLVALGTMIWATRTARRAVWLAGSGLLAVVGVKLLVFDLSAQGTIERVVSFLGTGVLWLVVGYFAPLPPRDPEAQETPHV